jgi:hypothetical protein
MTEALKRLLRECTVYLDGATGVSASGSGFFVAPGLILTAAHVVRDKTAPPHVRWHDRELGPVTAEWMCPENSENSSVWPLPDLALLSFPEEEAPDHPCVRLSAAEPGPSVFAEGYARAVDGSGRVQDSRTLAFQALQPHREYTAIRCTDQDLNDGMSGGPLLDLVTGTVVGVIKATKAAQLPLGGVAVWLDRLAAIDPQLPALNQRFHQVDRRWEFARHNRSADHDPADATREYLRLLGDVVAARPVILPPGRSMDDIAQTPSVRSLVADTDVGSTRDISALGLAGSDATEQSGGGVVLQWLPLRTAHWRRIILSGLPGLGKSCLLNLHAKTVATDTLARLDQNPAAVLSLAVPVLVDCAAYASALPEPVTANRALAALIDVFCASAAAEADVCPASAVIRCAYDDGRLVVCLDGLDEVAPADQERIQRAIVYLTEQNNQLLVTSRPYRGLDDVRSSLALSASRDAVRPGRRSAGSVGDVFIGDVVGFTPGQMYGFVHAWFDGDGRGRARLETALQDRRELRTLARIPLLAAILCHLGTQTEQLPGTPAKLYEAVISGALAGTWHERTQRYIDPNAAPDPQLRFDILAGAIGRLSGKWREGVDRFPQTELLRALAEQPGCDQAVAAARARWTMWRSRTHATANEPHREHVLLWEYKYDGLLVSDEASTGGPTVRFAHPVLAEYCIARHVAKAPDADLDEAVAEHRWFDPYWHEIWPLTAATMQEPERLVARLFDPEHDAWHEQLLLALRCITACQDRIDQQLVVDVVAAVSELVNGRRQFDAERALEALGEAIAAGVPQAAAAARELITDERTADRRRIRLIALLAEISDGSALAEARRIVVDRGVSAGYRAWCVRALVRSEDAEGIADMRKAVKSARIRGELMRLVSAIPVETELGSQSAFSVLRDQSVPLAIRAAVGRALVRSGIPELLDQIITLARSSITLWTLRTVLVTELLAIGRDEVIDIALVLARNPNVVAGEKSMLLEYLIRRGQTAVLDDAVVLTTRTDIHWERRAWLAHAIVELGDVGTEQLLRLVESARRPDEKIRALIALVRTGRAFDVAHEIIADPGAPPWIRTRLATAVLQSGDSQLPQDVAEELVLSDGDNGFEEELIAGLALREHPGAWVAARAYLTAPRARTLEYAGSRGLIDELAKTASGGVDLLRRIAMDPGLTQEDRGLAIIALADFAPDDAAGLTVSFAEGFSTFIRYRLLLALAAKGLPSIMQLMVDLPGVDDEAYQFLHQALSNPRATRGLLERYLECGRNHAQPPVEEKRAKIKLDAALLEDIGIDFSSQAERQHHLDWIYKKLQHIVGSKIMWFIDPALLVELDSMTDDTEREDWFNLHVSGYREMVREQFTLLRAWLSEDPSRVPPFRTAHNWEPLDLLVHTTQILKEWHEKTKQGGASACVHFLSRNEQFLVSDVAADLLESAAAIGPNGTAYVGLRYLVIRAISNGMQSVTQLLTQSDRLHETARQHYSEGNGLDVLGAAMAALDVQPSFAPEVSYFYGGLGAAMLDNESLAVALLSQSYERASLNQRNDGLNTIDEAALQFDWPDEKRARLRRALSGESPPAENSATADEPEPAEESGPADEPTDEEAP